MSSCWNVRRISNAHTSLYIIPLFNLDYNLTSYITNTHAHWHTHRLQSCVWTGGGNWSSQGKAQSTGRTCKHHTHRAHREEAGIEPSALEVLVCVCECVCWVILGGLGELLSGMYQAVIWGKQLFLYQWLVCNTEECWEAGSSNAFSFVLPLHYFLSFYLSCERLHLFLVHTFAHWVAVLFHHEGERSHNLHHSCLWLHTSSPSYPLQPLL